MLTKIAVIFIMVMVVLGMFGRLKYPSLPKTKGIKTAQKCKECGTYLIGDTPCSCNK